MPHGFLKADVLLVDSDPELRLYAVRDIGDGDAPEELALLSGAHGEHDLPPLQVPPLLFGERPVLLLAILPRFVARLPFVQFRGSRLFRKLFGNQKIPGVSFGRFHEIPSFSQFRDIFQQDDLHALHLPILFLTSNHMSPTPAMTATVENSGINTTNIITIAAKGAFQFHFLRKNHRSETP